MDREISGIKKVLLFSLILILLGVWTTSCSPKTPAPEYIDQPSLTPKPTLTPTQLPDYADWEGSDVEEGKYGRDDFCPVSFSYQYRSVGSLSVAVSNNISETEDLDETYRKIFQHYNQLVKSSLVNFQNPITVFVIPDLSIENCTSNNDVVFTSPGSLDDITFSEDIIGASTGIPEPWVNAGLAYIASGEEVDDQILKNWYLETEDLDILGLFVARFMTDWVSQEEIEIARMTAASLIKYASESENIPVESIGKRIDNDMRNRWLSHLGVERAVNYPYDGLYEPFQFSRSENCSVIVKSESMDFCLNKIEDNPYSDEVSDAEELIHRAYTGYQTITDYLMTNAPSISHLISDEEKFTIEVKNIDQPAGLSHGNTITLQKNSRSDFILGEIVRRYGWFDDLFLNSEGLLLQQGFSEYLGFLLPIYESPIKNIIWEDLNGLEGMPGISYWYGLDEEQLDTARAWYLQQGGSLDSEDVIDPRLFTDAVAFATMNRDAYGGVLGISIELKFQRYYEVSKMVGKELTDAQAASYVAWLCDTYSMDTVMKKYVNNEKDTALEGKDFETLKGDWLADLKAKGSGIPIPDSP